jgi:hypothetical protein
MHCLFLGIAKWIVKRIWIEKGILTEDALKEIQTTMENFQVPSDIGRIPGKVYCGEGFSNFTADQWKNFFIIYATVVLWKYLPNNDRHILVHFVKICQILTCRIMRHNMIDEAHERLIKVIRLIEQKYGQKKITSNLHLSLYLRECANDYGPLYSFWCFSFERMNGILGSLPNSNRNIEPELIKRLLNDKQIDLIGSKNTTKGFELLNYRQSVGSLSEMDQFSTNELYRFLTNTYNIQESVIDRSERFPGEFLHPSRPNLIMPDKMLDLLIQYYTATYETTNFRKPFTDYLNSVIINNRVNQYGRCRILSEIFGSAISSRYIKSSFVLAQFVNHDGSVDFYPGQIQYFFTHTINLANGPVNHKLAYIR